MPVALFVMWLGIAAFVLLMILAAYTPPTQKGKKSEFGFCIGAGVSIVAALASIFWMS